jgi:hypothetical protein
VETHLPMDMYASGRVKRRSDTSLQQPCVAHRVSGQCTHFHGLSSSRIDSRGLRALPSALHKICPSALHKICPFSSRDLVEKKTHFVLIFVTRASAKRATTTAGGTLRFFFADVVHQGTCCLLVFNICSMKLVEGSSLGMA